MSEESPPPPQSSRPLPNQGQAEATPPVGEVDDSTIIALHRVVPAPQEAGGQRGEPGPPLQPAAPNVPPPSAPAAVGPLQNLEPGCVINNMYRVIEAIDQGGMGRVFRGEEIGTGEPVAIKVILPEIAADANSAGMFLREAKVLRSLHHDAIVRYFAYLPPDHTINFHALIMGFIEGIKLSDRINTHGALNLSEMCRLFSHLASGLETAHRAGVVHRDLSPDNVMLHDGNIDKAAIIDFGISRSSTINDVTLGNQFAGKLKYVSPEQCGAFGGEADGRSDVYSLGLMMFFAATGKVAPMGNSIVEAVKLREAVPDLSTVPSEFQQLLYQMLQPDPNLRVTDMETVRQLLLQIGGGGTASMLRSLPPTTGFPMMPPPTTNRPVEGLQSAPSMGGSTVTGFGGGTTSQHPKGHAGDAEPRQRRRKGGGIKWLLIAVLLAGAATLTATQWSKLSGGGAQADLDPPEVLDNLARVPGGQETFLAEAVAPGCAFATRRRYGPHAGMIEGFHIPSVALSGLDAAWAAKFGSTTSMENHAIDKTQCAVIELARMFQGTKGGKIELSLASNLLSRKAEISGTLWDTAGKSDWLAIVTPNGKVYSLTARLQDAIGSERQFQFRIQSGVPGKYVLVAVSSGKALVRTGAMQNGTLAADIFKLIGRELGKDGQGSVDIGFVTVLP
ncbi:MAG: serine/threonine protein kinase [Rhodobacteraceae bacterium]|nr:serine/threonine protein kinase [Paracoccaceae bacterium]